ncbi:hypothetical protein LXL04_018231 [Taraxacum kok-saghyz]
MNHPLFTHISVSIPGRRHISDTIIAKTIPPYLEAIPLLIILAIPICRRLQVFNLSDLHIQRGCIPRIDTRFVQQGAIGVPNRGVPNRLKIAPIRPDHRFLESIPYATPIDPNGFQIAIPSRFHPDSVDSRSRFHPDSIPISSIPDRGLKRIDSISILPPTLGISTSA